MQLLKVTFLPTYFLKLIKQKDYCAISKIPIKIENVVFLLNVFYFLLLFSNICLSLLLVLVCCGYYLTK